MHPDQTDDRILDNDSKPEVERFEVVSSSSNVPLDGVEDGKVSTSTIVAVLVSSKKEASLRDF